MREPASSPSDEVANVNVKQVVLDVLPKKRKAAGIAESNSAKKLKTPRPNPLKRSRSKSTKRAHPSPKRLKDTTSVPHHDDKDIATTGDSEDEVDDQTDALLKGFESDGDEEKDPDDQGYIAGEDIPKVDKKTRRESKAAEKASSSGKPGVVYIGRIPHGFYEQEMRQYFSQFGTIINLRLSRNPKTGKSRHYAFIEFESAEVAEIVSKTMDNYLLFGHILKCKMVAPEQVHKDLWIGANRRFKTVPWNKLAGRKLQQAMTEEGWNKRIEREEKRRARKKEALSLMDYDFESPRLKSANDISKRKQSLTTTTGSGLGEEPKAIEAAKEPENQATAEKTKNENHIDDNAKPSNDEAEDAKDLATVIEAPSEKRRETKEKSSDKLARRKELKRSISVKKAIAGLAKKTRKVKKNEKRDAT